MAFCDRCFSDRNGIVTRFALALCGLLATAAISGCGTLQQSPQSQTQAQAQVQSQSQIVVEPKVVEVPAHPLPLRGRLVEGDPSDLPPAVAMSLSNNSPVTFTYREELTHDDYHVPLIVSALDPANLVGAPLGDYGVTAFASLSINDGERVLGDYTAKEHVSKSYNMYSKPTHKELEDAARAAVRQRIDQKLYSDENRLAEIAASSGKLATAPTSR
jgi:hypothetical protein